MVIYNSTKNNIVLKEGRVADSFMKRLKGLMFTPTLGRDEGLIITPCNSIHMFFMNYPLDVIFLNEKDEVVGIVNDIKPWRVSKVFLKAKYCIEMPVGTIEAKRISIGDRLSFSD